jgi:hypothetical protein
MYSSKYWRSELRCLQTYSSLKSCRSREVLHKSAFSRPVKSTIILKIDLSSTGATDGKKEFELASNEALQKTWPQSHYMKSMSYEKIAKLDEQLWRTENSQHQLRVSYTFE